MPFLLPLKPEHIYTSGTTGSGKSNTARSVVENFILLEQTPVLIFDNTRQWSGMGMVNRSADALKRFDQLGIGRELIRPFDIRIYTPMGGPGLRLPDDLSDLLTGTTVICQKEMTDSERCRNTGNILQVVYDSMNHESEKVRLLVVIEEAHSILPENVSPEARDYAKEASKLINRITREKKKYGCIVFIVTQSNADFRSEARVVREMIGLRLIHCSGLGVVVRGIPGYRARIRPIVSRITIHCRRFTTS